MTSFTIIDMTITKKLTTLSLALGALFLGACSDQASKQPLEEPSLIPLPKELSLTLGASYQLPKVIGFSTPDSEAHWADISSLLSTELGRITSLKVEQKQEGGEIRFVNNLEIKSPEGYTLVVSADGIEIQASTGLGFRHAVQTLAQLTDAEGRVHQAEIKDEPRFAYRGLMLDVSRHFMSTDFIIRLLDEMARYKLNRFHWHIVDGGGWRMQSDAYPLLTKKAAWRTERDWDKWWHGQDRRFVDEGTPGAYGGYYTKDDIRRVVAHASKLGITIIPEIELPGHSNEIAAAYPELFCLERWDKSVTDVCIGNEATFTFFERILDETLELFPSEYIHIGGDEAAMNHWGDCTKCRARIKAEGLKDLHELQSYMIKRIERFLLSRGRKLIGWDEILMGGLAPEATVMSWRGEAGGIEAAKSGHDVIMTPNGFLYLDYYQAIAEHQPRAIGGYVPLEKVYSYNPESSSLSAEEKKHVLGVQANLWTEYVESDAHAEYMYFPRALALAEIAWSPQEKRNYEDFRRRATKQTEALRARGVNAYPLNGIATEVSTDLDKQLTSLTLRAEQSEVEIRYTTDGSEPTAESELYQSPITTADSALVVAKLFKNGMALDSVSLKYRIDYHKAIAKAIKYANQWNVRYPAAGEKTLIDGIRATPTYLDGMWLGFTEPLDVTIDLGETRELKHIFARFMQEREQWVYMPREVEVLVSQDGSKFESLGTLPTQTDEYNPRPVFEVFDFFPHTSARYIRMRAEIGRSAGHFIFLDEIVIH